MYLIQATSVPVTTLITGVFLNFKHLRFSCLTLPVPSFICWTPPHNGLQIAFPHGRKNLNRNNKNYPNKNITLRLPRLPSSEVHPSLSAVLQIRLDLLLNLPVSILLILFSILKRELICSFRKVLSWRAKSMSVNKEG